MLDLVGLKLTFPMKINFKILRKINAYVFLDLVLYVNILNSMTRKFPTFLTWVVHITYTLSNYHSIISTSEAQA